jgi:hypothetical protein
MPTLWGSSYPGQIWKAAMLNMLGDINIGQFINAEYDEDDIIERSDSYYSYLEGRDDSEVLSDGYTVGDYRNDRVIGESVDSALNAMISLDRNSANFNEQLESKRNEVQAIINTIYSRKYTAEKQAQLDTLYQQMLGVSQTTEETAAETTGE